MADKREIKAIRALLSKYKINLKQLQAIIKGGKGVSERNDEILKRYGTVRGPVGKAVRGMQALNEQSKQKAKAEGRSTGLLGRFLHSESEKIKKQEARKAARKKKPTPLKDKSDITPRDVQTFKNFYNLNEPDFQRILQGNPQNDFENKVYSESKKIFTPDKMKKLPKTANKDHPAVQSYTKARDATSGSEYTQEQQDLNQQLVETLRGNQDPTVGGKEPTEEQKEQSPVEKEVAGLLAKAGVPAGASAAVAEHLPAFAQAYQQSGYEQRPQFGAPTDSPLVRGYDALINRIRPEEGGVSRFARKFRPMTNLAAGIGGRAGGTALGALVGLPALGGVAGGALGSLGANQLTNYLTQEQPELTRLADLLRGGQGGYFSRGTRGLADIIAGTQGKQSTAGKAVDFLRGTNTADILRSLMSGSQRTTEGQLLGKLGKTLLGGNPLGWLYGGQQAPTRFQRFRRGVASPIRGLGNILGSPNAARNIRLGLQGAQGLYDIGKATGINDWIARKLGFQQGPQYAHTGFETGEQLANPVIAGAVQRAIPFLQEQTGRILGRDVQPQEVMGNLDVQLRDVLMPQVMQRNIQRANEDVARRQIQQQVNVEQANQQARQAQRLLQQQEQAQNFEHQRALNQQRAMEAERQAELNIRANNLAAQQAALGQKITPQAPLRRVVQQPTRLWNVAEGVGNVVDPISGRLLAEGLPQKVNPVVRGK